MQSLLNELSSDIKSNLEKAFAKMEMIIWETNEEESLFRLEQCKLYLSHYSNITKSTNYLNTAMNLLGLEHSLVGESTILTKHNFILKMKYFQVQWEREQNFKLKNLLS